MAGKWGTGQIRKDRISKAGYDYNVIQGYVNRMIKTGKPIIEVDVDARNACGVIINMIVEG